MQVLTKIFILSGMRVFLGRLLVLILVAFLVIGCDPFKLAEESYGSLDKESINGLDALKANLENRTDDLQESAIVSRKAMREADLVVYVDRGGGLSEDGLERVEAMLFEIELPSEEEEGEEAEEEDDEEAEIESIEVEDPEDQEEEGIDSLEDALDVEDVQYIPGNVTNSNTLAVPGSLPTFGEGDDNDTEEKAKPKTFLFFLRDTNSSVAFYEKVLRDIRGHQAEEKVVLKLLHDRKSQRRVVNERLIAREILFGNRSMSYSNYKLARNLNQREEALPTKVAAWPVRLQPGPVQSLLGEDEYYTVDTLLSAQLADGESVDLIREFNFKNHRLILVYNTEPFLNFSQVKQANRLLLKELLDYSLKNAPANPVVSWVDSPYPATKKLPRDVENPYKMLFSFPINLVLLQLVLLLIMFLLSRWPHERPPLPERVVGTREFLEHIKALGIHLKRARNRNEVVEALLKYKRKQGLDVPDPSEFLKLSVGHDSGPGLEQGSTPAQQVQKDTLSKK